MSCHSNFYRRINWSTHSNDFPIWHQVCCHILIFAGNKLKSFSYIEQAGEVECKSPNDGSKHSFSLIYHKISFNLFPSDFHIHATVTASIPFQRYKVTLCFVSVNGGSANFHPWQSSFSSISDIYMNIKSSLRTTLRLNLLSCCDVNCMVYSDTFTWLKEGAACTSRINMDSMIPGNYRQASGQANK